jgi:hypothetical protein
MIYRDGVIKTSIVFVCDSSGNGPRTKQCHFCGMADTHTHARTRKHARQTKQCPPPSYCTVPLPFHPHDLCACVAWKQVSGGGGQARFKAVERRRCKRGFQGLCDFHLCIVFAQHMPSRGGLVFGHCPTRRRMPCKSRSVDQEHQSYFHSAGRELLRDAPGQAGTRA